MLYIYLPLLYYHGNLYASEGAYAGGRVFRCPSGLSCLDTFHYEQILTSVRHICTLHNTVVLHSDLWPMISLYYRLQYFYTVASNL